MRLDQILPEGSGYRRQAGLLHRQDGRIESGQPLIAAVIIEPEGEPKKILSRHAAVGMQLVHGTRVIVDSNAPQQALIDLLSNAACRIR